MVMVTHSGEVAEQADRVFRMENGKLVGNQQTPNGKRQLELA